MNYGNPYNGTANQWCDTNMIDINEIEQIHYICMSLSLQGIGYEIYDGNEFERTSQWNGFLTEV